MGEETDTLVVEETPGFVAKKTFDIPVTLEKIEFEGDDIRRNAIGNLRIPNSEVKVLSRYLRASVGSCHDLCKYGKKHVSETKARSPLLKRITETPFQGQDLVETVHLAQRKKTSVTSHKPSPDSQGQIFDNKQDHKKEVPASTKNVEISLEQVSSPDERSDVSAKHASNGKQREPSLISPKLLSDSQGQIPDKKKGPSEEVSANASNGKQQEPSLISPKPLPASQGQIPDNKQQVIVKEIPVSSRGEGSDVSVNASNGKQQEPSVISLKPLPDSQDQKPDNKQQVIKKEIPVSSPGEGSDVSAKHASNVKEQESSEINLTPMADSNSQISNKQLAIKKKVSASAKKVLLASKQVSSPRKGIDVYAKHASNRKLQDPSVSSPKPLPNSKNQIPDKCQIIRKKVLASTMEEVSSPRERVLVSAEHGSVGMQRPLKTKSASLSNLGHSSTRRFSEITIPKETEALKLIPEEGSRSRRKSDIDMSKEVVIRKKNDVVPPTFSLSPKPSVKTVLSPKSGSYKNPKRMSLWKNQNTARKDGSGQPSEEEVPEKTLYVIETRPVKFTMELSQNGSHTSHPSLSTKEKNLGYNQIGKGTSQCPPSQNENLRHPKNGIQSTKSSSSSSLLSENRSLKCTLNRTHDAEFSSSSLTLLSSSSSVSKSLQTDESIPNCEGGKNETENQIANQKVEPKTRSRKIGGIRSENKDCSPRKLNFRRAKLLDVQSENKGPRKLKFRQGKVRVDNQNGKADTESSLGRVVDGDLNDTETGSKKVVLRHQAVEGRRHIQSLFNYMIEDNASKHCFRRGKLVDIQSENSSPRRLRFRQQNVPDENQNGKADTKRRSSRRLVDGKSNGTQAGSEKVVLRHQSVEGKKDVQSLFNNVIEETASKLVQTRKSKVKALVGAFETVISLQDTKSLATTSA